MAIIVDKLNYIYSPGTAYEQIALKDISFVINDGEFVGIIGHTGSGKSTLIQHLNGLIKANSGGIYYNGEDIYDRDYSLKKHREKVGMVFQYPEHQLFETSVLEDVKFGPKNQGLDDKAASIRAYEALEMLRFPRDLIEQSPFDLSGGQKRLCAIAGVLAMKPEVIILDEPTSGLDPKGREEILEILKALREQTKSTVILVSHSMEDVARFVDRLLVLDKGQLVLDGPTREVFAHIKELEETGLAAPEVNYLMRDLLAEGIPVDTSILTKEEAVEEILRALKRKC